MLPELFFVSVLYWIGIFILFLWLNRRLAGLTEKLAALKDGETERRSGP